MSGDATATPAGGQADRPDAGPGGAQTPMLPASSPR